MCRQVFAQVQLKVHFSTSYIQLSSSVYEHKRTLWCLYLNLADIWLFHGESLKSMNLTIYYYETRDWKSKISPNIRSHYHWSPVTWDFLGEVLPSKCQLDIHPSFQAALTCHLVAIPSQSHLLQLISPFFGIPVLLPFDLRSL